ncbi:MAG: hypothetical protein ACXWSF_21420, partial [Bdellovibrionota bacterium]
GSDPFCDTASQDYICRQYGNRCVWQPGQVVFVPGVCHARNGGANPFCDQASQDFICRQYGSLCVWEPGQNYCQ